MTVKEPTSRAGILAAGLVRITLTSAELEAAGSWWSAETHADRCDADAKRARSEGLRAGLPYWLRPPVTPRDTVARMFREGDSERRAACEYLAGRRVVVVSEMTPAQLRTALGAQLRRLSGQWGDDKALDVIVAPLDPAAVDLEPAVHPKKVRKTRIRALKAVQDAPAPRPATIPAPALSPPPPVPTAPLGERPPRPPRTGKRDRLAWVPVMQRLSALYAAKGGPPMSAQPRWQ